MKVFKRILIVIAFLLGIVLISGFFFLRYLGQRAVPDYNKDIELLGLTDEVRVYRDSFAIPHIYAKNEADLYRVSGYVMAQDRLWQMDLIRRATQGRLSEIFGEEYTNTDLFLRALRIPDKSDLVFNDLPGERVEVLKAFADGITQYIEQHIHTLPPEFAILGYNPDPWEVNHIINIIGYMAWDLASGAYSTEVLFHEILEKLGWDQSACLMPHIEEREGVVYPEFHFSQLDVENWLTNESYTVENLGIQVFNGSNNWVVSGKKSVTGMPLFANDMHLGFSSQGIWYQMHQVIEGELNVTGISVPGAPFIIAGHNEKIAWGLTNLYVDDIDLYIETINPDEANEYRLDGEWKNMEVRKETIYIKGGDSVILENKFTHRGPIISGFKSLESAVSMKWIGNEDSNELRTVYLLNRARNWDEFKEAISTFNSISQNFAYADVDGNIGLYAGGGVPIRKGPGYLIHPGDTSAYDWTGRVPFDQLPHSFNPESGYVASANNKTAGNDYPYYIGSYFSEGYRMQRIVELLNEKEKLSIEDFRNIQADQVSYLAKMVVPEIVKILQEADLNEYQQRGFDILLNWDFDYDKEAAAPLIFEDLYFQLIKNLLEDDMGSDLFERYNANGKLPRQFMHHFWKHKCPEIIDNKQTPGRIESFDDVILKSFTEVMEALKTTMGAETDDWKWGQVHQITLQHPMGQVSILDKIFHLNNGPHKIGGSFHTVSPYTYSFSDRYSVSHGASHRHIYSTENWDDSRSVIPTGESGIPASEHYCDQTEMYLNNQYHVDPFTETSVKVQTKYSAVFKPRINK